MNYAETYPLNVTPQGDSTRSAVEKNRKEILSLVTALNAQPSGAVGGSRQRVLSAAMLSGAWNFLSSDGLAVIINGSVTPVIMSFADGCGEIGNIDYIGVVRDKISAWQLPANNTSYLYIERSDAGALTYGSTTIAPVEQDSTPSAGTNDVGLCWFSTLESKMYVWTGSAWQHKVRLFVGDNDQVPIGYSNFPEKIFGFSFGGEFKNFDFSVLFQGASNVSTIASNVSRQGFNNNRGAVKDLLKSWTYERYASGQEIKYPRFSVSDNSHNYMTSTYWLEDASYLRLKNVEIGYTWRSPFFKRIGISSLRLYANGSNLLTWADLLPGEDPESPMMDTNNEPYPVTRTYNLGVSINF